MNTEEDQKLVATPVAQSEAMRFRILLSLHQKHLNAVARRPARTFLNPAPVAESLIADSVPALQFTPYVSTPFPLPPLIPSLSPRLPCRETERQSRVK